MKRWFYLIPVLLLAGLVVLLHRAPSPVLAKINISSEDGQIPGKSGKNRIGYLQARAISYYEHRNRTLPGRLLEIDGGREEIRFKPGLSGKYFIRFLGRNLSSAEMIIRLYQDQIPVAEGTAPPGGDYRLSPELSLGRRDELTITVHGRGRILLANPILYRPIPPEERTFVFLICADTLRADHLKIYGYPRATAPNISRWAEDCVIFEQAYAQSSWTLPSHMSLFTGLYEFNHGVRSKTRLAEDISSLVENLSRKFATRSFNGGVYVSFRYGFCRGFDSYQVNRYDLNAPQASENLFRAVSDDLDRNPYPRTFYFLHTYQVHSPYNPTPEFLQPFNPSPEFTVLPLSDNAHSIYRHKFQKKPPRRIQNFIDLYDAEIYTFDHWFGHFLDAIKKRGIYDRSLIILMSDHGDEFFEHGGWEHTHTLYNELIKVPLLIKFPDGQYRGQRIQGVVGLVDIMPTILEYTGTDYPRDRIDGINLLPVIRGKKQREYVLSSNTTSFYVPALPFKICSIRGHDKMIYNLPYTEETLRFFHTPPPPVPPYEFYQLDRDPGENRNLYSLRQYQYGRFLPLFEDIVRKAGTSLQQKLKSVDIDPEMEEKLKSLGYL